MLAELVGAQPVPPGPVRRGRRRRPRFGLLAAGLALLLVGGLAGLLRPGLPAPTPTIPEDLADVVTDFGTAFTPGKEGPFTLDTLERFLGADADNVRPALKRLGLRRGFARSLVFSADGELLGVLVMEFGSAGAARAAGPQIGVCRGRPEGDFEVPAIAGATGRRCQDGDGQPVQEVVFARGPLLYKVKLERIRGEPRSTSRIVDMARLQADEGKPLIPGSTSARRGWRSP